MPISRILVHYLTISDILRAALLAVCRAQEAAGGKAAAEEGKAGRDPRFTGDPQIDWEFDPNLPRELQGFNMTGYPFFSRVPPKMKFSCNDRIDGFYANTEYKCQVRAHAAAARG